ncbi:MAG: hypothetical protein E7267_00200 [Lachnospiraceae bacterium]|nr:hypothetical protein [Lachnospiraceae bacterium]
MNNEKKKYYYSKNMLFIRMLIGGYLVYLAYSLIESYISNADKVSNSSMPVPVLIIASIIFMAVGLAVAIISLKGIIKGEYKGGKADFSEEEYSEDAIEENIAEENITEEITTDENEE